MFTCRHLRRQRYPTSVRLGAAATSPATGTTTAQSRLWKLDFADSADLADGGTLTSVLPQDSPVQMQDNLTDDGTRLVLQEDVGGNAHLGKVWSYDKASGELTLAAQHDPARFGNDDTSTPVTAPFTIDEESSGVMPATDILGAGWFFLDVQVHGTSSSVDRAVGEKGQLLAIHLPPTGGPTPVVPEVPLAALLPLAAVAVLGGAFVVRRRTA